MLTGFKEGELADLRDLIHPWTQLRRQVSG